MDASLLEFGKGEAVALADLHVVADRGAVNGRTKGLEGTGTKRSCALDTVTVAALFTTWLVEPRLYSLLPVLAEVVVGEGWFRSQGSRLDWTTEDRKRGVKLDVRLLWKLPMS